MVSFHTSFILLFTAAFLPLLTGAGKTLNLLWPGSSWASISCGLQYQFLSSQGYEIQHIMGASGGAASAIMMLSDPNPNSLAVLRTTYEHYGAACDFDTACWANVYHKLMDTIPGAFARVKQFGKASLVCDGTPMILYNFSDSQQAAEAFAASGGNGPVKGISSHCGDGGVVKQYFPESMRATSLAYFGTTAPQETPTGLPSFPFFCPGGSIIVYNGYNCLDWLLNASAIDPKTFTATEPPGIEGMSAFGTKGSWVDCGVRVSTD